MGGACFSLPIISLTHRRFQSRTRHRPDPDHRRRAGRRFPVRNFARQPTVLPEPADQLPVEVHRKVSLDHPMNHQPKRAVRFRHMLTFAALVFQYAILAHSTAPDTSSTLSTPDFRYQAGTALPAATRATSASPPSSFRAPASDASPRQAGWDTGPCLCRSG